MILRENRNESYFIIRRWLVRNGPLSGKCEIDIITLEEKVLCKLSRLLQGDFVSLHTKSDIKKKKLCIFSL